MPAEMFYTLPVSFYGYDSLIYIVSAIIGFAIAYKAHKLYSFSENKSHFYLYTSFMILSVGLLTISLTSTYTYFSYFTEGTELVFNGLFDIADMGFWIYFGSSFLAYVLLVVMHMPEKHKDKFLLALPISLNYYAYFNVVLFFMIAFVAFRSAINHFSQKNTESLLVLSSFLLLTIYHAILLFTPFGKIYYVIAHVALIAGFLSLLTMLVRVGK